MKQTDAKKLLDQIQSIVDKQPNDTDLGSEVRKLLNEQKR